MSNSLARKRRRARTKQLRKLPTPPPPPPAPAADEVPVSVTIIAKDCAESLKQCCLSLRTHFLRECDELLVLDTGSTDGGATVRAAYDCGARVVDGSHLRRNFRPFVKDWAPEHLEFFEKSSLVDGCLMDFGEARRLAMDAATHDVQFWIDADDELVEKQSGAFRAVVDDVMGKDRGDAVFLDYLYGFDPDDGSCCSVLKRERVIDRRKYYWTGRCHETAIPRPGVDCLKGAAYLPDLKSAIKHAKPLTKGLNPSDLRNYVILRNEYEEAVKAGAVDPRTIFYLGNSARGIEHNVEALQRYGEFIDKSGSVDDRLAASYYAGNIYAHAKTMRPLDGLDWFFRCIRLKPDDPRGYYGVSRCYLLLSKYAEALHWFNIGRMLPEPVRTLHAYDPRHIHVLPLQVALVAAKELGDEAAVVEYGEALKKVSPNHPDTKTVLDIAGNWLAGRRLVESIRTVVANARPEGPAAAQDIGRKAVSLLADVPAELEDMGLAPTEPPEDRPPAPSVAIYCGKAPEAWGPKSGVGGIGGSEKAVVQMAGRLQARGLNVTVYANVPRDQRGKAADGVVWRHYGAFDRTRPRDLMFLWRAPELLDLPVPAKRRVVWCHDVQVPGKWTKPRVTLADEVWVLSKYHATTLGPAAEALGPKLVVTRNGIDAPLFKRLYGGPRDPHKIIYASSPDRGLLTAIRIYQAAKKGVPFPGGGPVAALAPEARLHVYYGFNKPFMDAASNFEYRSISDIGRDGSLYEYMQSVHRAIDHDDTIKFHGRVGWEEMAKEMCGAGAWFYPTRFPEISCMAAMEAQAAGLFPVHTGHAALGETVFLDGYKHTNEADLALALVDATTRDTRGMVAQRQWLHEEACRRFDYEVLADEWAARIRSLVL